MKLRHHPSLPLLVSDDGTRVFQQDGESWLPLPVRWRSDYLMVSLRGGKSYRLHRLVLETYARDRRPGEVARHRNGLPQDCHIQNLRWGTQKQNGEDTVRHGRSTRGERNAQAKLTTDDVLGIRCRLARGVASKDLAAMYGVSPGTICDIAKGRTWKHLNGVKA